MGAIAWLSHDDDAAHHRAQPHRQSRQSPAERWPGPIFCSRGPGLDLGRGEYQPEPDFGVIDADYGAGQRLVEGAYLLAEVVSATDYVSVPGTDRQWIDVKRDLYRGHEHCEAVLVIVEDRMEVGLDLKTETG